MTPRELNEHARDLPFEELVLEVTPLLSKHAGRYAPGFDREDVMQELLEVLYRAQLSYDPALGGFLNLLIVSFDNRLDWLNRKGRAQVRPITSVSCPACDTPQPRYRWGSGYRCEACGSRKLDIERGNLISMDVMLNFSDGEDSRASAYQGPSQADVGYDVVDAVDLYQRMPRDRQLEVLAEIRS